MLTLVDALEALTNIRPSITNPVITEAAVDSRQVIPGSLFVALQGERADGHDYVVEAFKRGASFALIQHEIDLQAQVLDLRSGLVESTMPVINPPICLKICSLNCKYLYEHTDNLGRDLKG